MNPPVVIDFPGRLGSPATMPPQRLGYREIAADLISRVYAGEYPPGSLLPSYAQLAAMYSVSVTTAQNALRILRDKGLYESVSGRGNFVVDRLPDR